MEAPKSFLSESDPKERMTLPPPIDIIFIFLAFLLVVRCSLRGFVAELMPIAAVVLGLLGSLYMYKNGGIFLREKFFPNLHTIPEILSFIAIFVIIFCAIKFLEHIIKDIIQRMGLDGGDRFLGFLFGFVEGLVLISLVIWIFTVQPLFDERPLLKRSIFAEHILPIINGKNPVRILQEPVPARIPLESGPAESDFPEHPEELPGEQPAEIPPESADPAAADSHV
jgi:membrane protein required for colicin V production